MDLPSHPWVRRTGLQEKRDAAGADKCKKTKAADQQQSNSSSRRSSATAFGILGTNHSMAHAECSPCTRRSPRPKQSRRCTQPASLRHADVSKSKKLRAMVPEQVPSSWRDRPGYMLFQGPKTPRPRDTKRPSSLSRLCFAFGNSQIACIDLYQAHIDDPVTPLEETLGAFAGLIKEEGRLVHAGAHRSMGPEQASSLVRALGRWGRGAV